MRQLRCLLSAIFVAPALAAGAPLELATAKVVDLTHAFDSHTLYWPTSPSGFELKQLS